jgi:hypothetical protein
MTREYRCEMGVGWTADAYGQPRGHQCGQPGKLYSGFMWTEVVLCDEHHEYMLTRKGASNETGR